MTQWTTYESYLDTGPTKPIQSPFEPYDVTIPTVPQQFINSAPRPQTLGEVELRSGPSNDDADLAFIKAECAQIRANEKSAVMGRSAVDLEIHAVLNPRSLAAREMRRSL